RHRLEPFGEGVRHLSVTGGRARNDSPWTRSPPARRRGCRFMPRPFDYRVAGAWGARDGGEWKCSEMPVEWPPPASPSSCPPPPLSPWRRHRRPPASRRLVFNEGYAATSGDALVRRELCAEAIRLGRL